MTEERYEPLARWGHISVAIGDKVYLWGGRIDDFSDESRTKLSSVVEVFDCQSELWVQRSTAGKPPKGLYNCAYTHIGNKIYVYGGWDGEVNHSSLHSLDVDSMTWEELVPQPSSENPMRMTGSGLVSHGDDKLILFGGYGIPNSGQRVRGVKITSAREDNTSLASNDTGEGEEGEVLRILSPSPDQSVRSDETTTVLEETMTNEVKIFNITDRTWSNAEVTGDIPPPCVDFSFTKADQTRAVVFGGFQPDCGTTSDAYLLDIETWNWVKLGSVEDENADSAGKPQKWPCGRDGHAACVLSDGLTPQILVTGGWDKQNQLLYDSWVLNVTTATWTELPGVASSNSVGPRFWHTVNCVSFSHRLRQLVFFGGCPTSPSEAGDSDWDRVAKTVVVEIGLLAVLSVTDPSFGEQVSEWVVLDAVDHAHLGQPLRRMRETVLFAQYRAVRAETTAREMLRKMETRSPPPPAILSTPAAARNTPSPDNRELLVATPLPKEEVPFWVIPQEDIIITPSEVSRGRWTIVRVGKVRNETVTATSLSVQNLTKKQMEVFMQCMDTAARLQHHPNILSFYGAVIEPEPIIVTEHQQVTLRTIAEKNSLTYHQIIDLGLDIASGLEFLHSNKPEPIVHGELSCACVMIIQGKGNRYKAKIADFITAKFFQHLVTSDDPIEERRESFSPLQRHGSVSSLPRYGSLSNLRDSPSKEFKKPRKTSVVPQDVIDPSMLSTEKDVYQFGLVTIEMCTSSLPLEISLVFLIKSIRWTEMSSLINECISKEPTDRPTMSSVLDKLNTFSHAVSIRSVR